MKKSAIALIVTALFATSAMAAKPTEGGGGKPNKNPQLVEGSDGWSVNDGFYITPELIGGDNTGSNDAFESPELTPGYDTGLNNPMEGPELTPSNDDSVNDGFYVTPELVTGTSTGESWNNDFYVTPDNALIGGNENGIDNMINAPMEGSYIIDLHDDSVNDDFFNQEQLIPGTDNDSVNNPWGDCPTEWVSQDNYGQYFKLLDCEGAFVPGKAHVSGETVTIDNVNEMYVEGGTSFRFYENFRQYGDVIYVTDGVETRETLLTVRNYVRSDGSFLFSTIETPNKYVNNYSQVQTNPARMLGADGTYQNYDRWYINDVATGNNCYAYIPENADTDFKQSYCNYNGQRVEFDLYTFRQQVINAVDISHGRHDIVGKYRELIKNYLGQ